MDNSIPVFDEIQYKELRPWLHAFQYDEMIEAMQIEIKLVLRDTFFHYKIDFYWPFNNKTTYDNKLLTNETAKYSQKIIRLIADREDIRIKKYLLNDALHKKLKSRLHDLGKLIKERQFDLAFINPKKTSFDLDQEHKSNTYRLPIPMSDYQYIKLL